MFSVVSAQTPVDPEWVFRWIWEPTETEQGDVIEFDQSGNVYVAGHTDTSTSYNDWVLVKVSPTGDSVWSAIYDSPTDGIDEPEYIGVDESENIYVCGDVGRSSLAWKMDAAVVKFDRDGNQLWAHLYNSSASLDDRVEGFGLDHAGNIFVVGYTQLLTGSPGREDYLLVKLLPTGDTAWVRTLPTGNGTNDRLYDIAFDAADNIYVTGGHSVSGTVDIATIKYNQNGDTLWMRLYNGPNSDDDIPYGIGVDDSGYVYVGGTTMRTSKDFLAIKYDSQGNFVWDFFYDGIGAGLETARDMIADGNGNVYILGETTASGQKDILAVCANHLGALAWDFQYDGGGNADEIVFNSKSLLKTDAYGNLYFGGASYYIPPGLTLTNTLTFKLNQAGDLVWYNRYCGPGNDFNQIRGVNVDPNGNCFVTGYSTGVNNNWDLFLLKFTGTGGPTTGTISGHVFESDGTTPLGDVIVMTYNPLDELVAVDTSDAAGAYAIDLNPDIYSETFTKAGYNDTTVENIVVTAGNVTSLSVNMTQSGGCVYVPGDINGNGAATASMSATASTISRAARAPDSHCGMCPQPRPSTPPAMSTVTAVLTASTSPSSSTTSRASVPRSSIARVVRRRQGSKEASIGFS